MFNSRKFLQRMNEHFIAHGMFNQEFSYLENLIKILAEGGVLAGTHASPRPITGNTLHKVMENVKLDRKTQGLPVSAYLEKAFIQLDLIRKARNRLAHSGVQFHERYASVAQDWNKLADGKPSEIVSPAIFKAMRDDMVTIQGCLLAHMGDIFPATLTFDQARRDLKIRGWVVQMLKGTGIERFLAAFNLSSFSAAIASQPFQYVPKWTSAHLRARDIRRQKASPAKEKFSRMFRRQNRK